MPLVPYTSIVGSLMYATVCTRPNIAQAVGVFSRYMENPAKEHWEDMKWLLRYLRGLTSWPLDSTHSRMMSGVNFHHNPLTTHMVGRR